MNRALIFALVTGALVMTAQDSTPVHAAMGEISAPKAPGVDFVNIHASRVHLGMAAADVTRIMGQAAGTKTYLVADVEVRVLDYPAEPIATTVTLSNGKVSSVSLDIAGIDDRALPPFSRKASLGMQRDSVLKFLGAPSEDRHYTFSGIQVDQLVFARPGESDVSVFFVDARVVTKKVGRALPPDILRIVLPSSPDAAREEPMVGMTTRDVKALCGAEKFSVHGGYKDQPAEYAVYENRGGGSFTSFTFIGDVLTELSDLGGLPADDVFQGR